jgi:flagellar biosynthesis GTPase FlhF
MTRLMPPTPTALKFKGNNLQEAVEAVQRTWGPGAIVLHVEKTRVPGGLFQKAREWVEVTARPPVADAPVEIDPSAGGLVTSADQLFSSNSKSATHPQTGRSASPGVLDEISELKEKIDGFGATMRQMERIQWARGQVELRETQHPLMRFLIEKGLSQDDAIELVADWAGENPNLDLAACAQLFERRLKTLDWSSLFPRDHGRCTLFMGLPGAGKTLLLVKIAARMKLFENTRVHLISADMTRPGPSHELSLYGEVLDIPITQIFNLQDLKRVMGELTSDTHLLVDWGGISPHERESWEPLLQFKACHPHAQILLTASLASDLDTWKRLRDQFLGLPLVGLALTQADLEPRWGKVYGAIRGTNLPLAAVSTGKNVPGDFIDGKAFPLSDYLFKGQTRANRGGFGVSA